MAGGSVCKSCGALLPLPDAEGHVSCMSCGRTERVAVKEPKPSPGASAGASPGTVFVSWSPEDAGSVAAAAKTARRGVGCIVGVIVLSIAVPVVLAVAGIFAGTSAVRDALDEVGSAVGPKRHLSPSGYEVLALPPSDGGGLEVVTVVYEGQRNARFLARAALGAGGGDGWESDPFPSGVNDAQVILSDRTLFAVIGEELWALVADTGAISWRAPLSDVVRSSCETCFQPLGDGVVLLTADGQVFAYGPGSATARWGHRLAGTNSQLAVSDAGVAVVDDSPESPGRKQVVVLDAATGAVVSTFVPQCNPDRVGGGFNFTDQVYAIGGSSDLLATVSTSDSCAVRWNAGTGQVAWSAQMEGANLRDRGLLTDDRFYVSSRNGISAVDLASGSVLEVAAPADSEVEPLFRTGDLLVAESATSRGTARPGLAAYEAATGELRWRFDLPGGGELLPVGGRSSDALFGDDGRSVAFAVDGGVVVATFAGGSRTVTTREVDLATGVLGQATVAQLPSRSGTPSVSIHSADAGGLLFTIDNKIVRLPLGGEPVLWPGE